MTAVTVASALWLAGADERRVHSACGTWLEHRGQLRSAVGGAKEAAGRAALDGTDVRDEHDDLELANSWVDSWRAVSPRLYDSLHGSRRSTGSGSPEDILEFALGQVDIGLGLLQEAVDSGRANEVEGSLDDVRARFQWVDDVCLDAARGT